MSDRFKPIGGMFQGVRGSTVKGGTEGKAKHLVLLDDDGVLDESTFPTAVREAASVSDALDDEIASRKNSDSELQAEIDDLNEKIEKEHDIRQAEDATIEETLGSRLTEVDSKATAAYGEANVANSDIRCIKIDVYGTDTPWDWEHPHVPMEPPVKDALSSLSNGLSNVQSEYARLIGEVSDVQDDVSSLGTSLSSVSTHVDALQTTVNNIVAGSSGVQPQLNELSERISALGTAIDALRTEMSNNFTVINTKISGINANITDLDRRVTALEEKEPSNY